MTAAEDPVRSHAFGASVEQLRALARLTERGESQTERGHELRARLESLWYELSPDEQDLIEALSTDLRTLAEQPPPGPEPTAADRAELDQAISARSWSTVLSLLRECPRLSHGADGALLRADAWRALGADPVAAEFYAQASKLLGRGTIPVGAVTERRRDLAKQSGAQRKNVRPFLMEHTS